MKKNFYIFTFLLFGLFFCQSSHAQLQSNTVAPDFTVTDLDGNEHNLYTYLDEGKSVILDLYAVWCPPCWSYHNSGIFKDLWDAHGPDGDNTLVIIAVEADPTTAIADIDGGGESLGDWTAGVEYVMANDDDIADLYNLAYYPTIYYITPSKLITETAQQSEGFFNTLLANQPPVPSGNNNAVIINYTDLNETSKNYCGNEAMIELNPTVGVQNIGAINLTSVEVKAMVGEEVIGSQSWTGNAAPLEYFEVNLSDISFTAVEDVTEITFEVSAPNGFEDDDTFNTYVDVFSHVAKTETETITVEVLTDQYADETYWVVLNSNGDIIAEGGNPNVGLDNIGTGEFPAPSHPDMYNPNTEYIAEFEIEIGDCYDFIVTDYYGDGLCCTYGDGYVNLKNSAGELLSSIGEFGIIDQSGFLNAVVGVAPTASFEVSVEDATISVTNSSEGDDITEYVWNWGDGNTTTGDSPEAHTYAESGEYTITLEVTNAFGTSTYTETVIVTVPAVETNIETIDGVSGINLFPQPATDQINVTFNLDGAKVLNIAVLNSVGQVVKNLGDNAFNYGSNNIVIDVNDFTSGMYFVNFEQNGQKVLKRFTVIK